MNETILITGASGFLGSRLAAALVDRGLTVIGATRHNGTPPRLSELTQRGLRLIRWDPTNPANLFDTHPTLVLHAAACYGRAGETDASLVEANVCAGLRLLQASETRGIKAFLHIGTGLPPEVSPYARSKRQFADWVAQPSHALPTVEVRCEHFYGGGDDPSKFTTRIARSCLANHQTIALTAGVQRRDFIHIDDVISALITVIERGIPPHGHRCFQLGSGEAHTVRHVVETIHRLAGSSSQLAFGAVAQRLGEPEFCCADTTALRALGWSPITQLETGLSRLVSEERQICAF